MRGGQANCDNFILIHTIHFQAEKQLLFELWEIASIKHSKYRISDGHRQLLLHATIGGMVRNNLWTLNTEYILSNPYTCNRSEKHFSRFILRKIKTQPWILYTCITYSYSGRQSVRETKAPLVQISNSPYIHVINKVFQSERKIISVPHKIWYQLFCDFNCYMPHFLLCVIRSFILIIRIRK